MMIYTLIHFNHLISLATVASIPVFSDVGELTD